MNPPKGQSLDHKNRNKLDNRRENLRYTTPRQNAQNRGNHNILGVGYYLHKASNRWKTQIKVNGISKHLGYYNTPEEAKSAYDSACKLLI